LRHNWSCITVFEISCIFFKRNFFKFLIFYWLLFNTSFVIFLSSTLQAWPKETVNEGLLALIIIHDWVWLVFLGAFFLHFNYSQNWSHLSLFAYFFFIVDIWSVFTNLVEILKGSVLFNNVLAKHFVLISNGYKIIPQKMTK